MTNSCRFGSKSVAATLPVVLAVVLCTFGWVSNAAASSGEADDDQPWFETASDKVIIETVRAGVDDLAASLAPGFEGKDKKVDDDKLYVWRKPLPIGQRSALLAVVSADLVTATAATKCRLAVVLDKKSPKKKPKIVAKRTFCWGGRTGVSFEPTVLRLTRDLPLLMWTTESWTGDGNHVTYTFYRVDQGKFEDVLNFSTFTPQGHDKTSSQRCTGPLLDTPSLPSTMAKTPTLPELEEGPEPNAVTATWLCRDSGSGQVTQVRTRVWAWTGQKYAEVTPQKLEAFPRVMGGPAKGDE